MLWVILPILLITPPFQMLLINQLELKWLIQKNTFPVSYECKDNWVGDMREGTIEQYLSKVESGILGVKELKIEGLCNSLQ